MLSQGEKQDGNEKGQAAKSAKESSRLRPGPLGRLADGSDDFDGQMSHIFLGWLSGCMRLPFQTLVHHPFTPTAGLQVPKRQEGFVEAIPH